MVIKDMFSFAADYIHIYDANFCHKQDIFLFHMRVRNATHAWIEKAIGLICQPHTMFRRIHQSQICIFSSSISHMTTDANATPPSAPQ